ncbi:hypothetical protein Q3G72_019432 [Acer saccharum]|nr:hypothetical protein Q3G72_019432 [Acer saccharum]
MEEEHRMSTRTRKVAPKMAAALASTDNRTQAALARLEALENDNAGIEHVEIHDDDDDAFLDDDDDVYIQKKQLKGTKRKTRQAKALEDARKAPRTFLELLHERWDLQAPLLAAISALFVVLLVAICVSSVPDRICKMWNQTRRLLALVLARSRKG